MEGWKWLPDKSPWYFKTKESIGEWRPAASLQADEGLLKEVLLDACDEKANWLFHPCISPIYTSIGNAQGDFQLMLWVASNSSKFRTNIVLEKPLYAWNVNGSELIEPGSYDIGSIVFDFKPEDPIAPVALDIWGDSFGGNSEDLAKYNPFGFRRSVTSEDDLQSLRGQIVRFYSMLQFYGRLFPDAHEWLVSTTKVVCPFTGSNPDRFRSSSINLIPGIIWADLHGGDLQIIESLVHETAHQYLFIAETDAPLIKPGDKPVFSSPLRKDPRPLRGIFLAFHALAYMAHAYFEIATLTKSDSAMNAGNDILTRCKDAESTLEKNFAMLTENGASFFEKTKSIADAIVVQAP